MQVRHSVAVQVAQSEKLPQELVTHWFDVRVYPLSQTVQVYCVEYEQVVHEEMTVEQAAHVLLVLTYAYPVLQVWQFEAAVHA